MRLRIVPGESGSVTIGGWDEDLVERAFVEGVVERVAVGASAGDGKNKRRD